MTKPLRSPARIGTLAALSAAALTAALGVALPATAAAPTAHLLRAPHASTAVSRSTPTTRVVTLVTGDRVVLRQDAAGHTLASLTRQSPHYGGQVEHVSVGSHTWVIPRMSAAAMTKLDPSLFEVSALAARSGRIPLTVTFARGMPSRHLPGLDVRPGSARTTAGGRTTVTASYDAHQPLPARFASSLAGVSAIAVKGADTDPALSADSPDYQLQTLTINATNMKGAPMRAAMVFLVNTDDGRLFAAQAFLVDGQWKVSVPQGSYIAFTSSFSRVVTSVVTVSGDTTLPVAFADATVRPSLSVPNGHRIDAELDLMASDSNGLGIDMGMGGSTLPRINPLPADPSIGLTTELASLWAPDGYRPFVFSGTSSHRNPITRVTATKEVLPGIPRHLTFHYHPSTFAQVAIKHYATGPEEHALDSWFGWSPLDQFAFVQDFPSIRPGVIQARFEGDPRINWASYTTGNSSFRDFTQLQSVQAYRPHEHATIPFFRGPVTPVVDRGSEFGVTGANCALCVKNGTLHGLMSMMTSAGTRQVGCDDSGRWDLSSGRHTLQSGRGQIRPHVTGIAPGTVLTLEAHTTAPDSRYQLSSEVYDGWRTTMPAKDGPVPILRASYVPPTNLDGVATQKVQSFPISFDNLGPVHSRVTKLRVQWAVDGMDLHPAIVRRTGGTTFHVSVPARATKRDSAVTLVVQARDAAGRQMAELVRNAYLLPKGSTHAGQHQGPRPAEHRQAFHPGKLCRTGAHSHQYGCFVKLSPSSLTGGRTSDPGGWGAPALRQAYDLSGLSGDSTVAVIDAYDLPTAEKDMNTYRRQFGLPACTSASGCFTKLNQNGAAGPYPQQDYGWGVEESLDLQMISAACPTCHIVLVEAKNPGDPAFAKAETAAVAAGATVTTHSYGRQELTGDEGRAAIYDHPGVTAVASTGDYAYGPANFPASSPDVVAVGGTTLARSLTDPRGWTERAWKDGASGCSAYFGKVPGQTDTGCHGRTESDISAIAQGLAIYDTSLPKKYRGWNEVSGTSASSPFVAGIIGASGSAGIRPSDLYAEPGVFHDIVTGSNGFCQGSYLCTAVPGYDAPTGLGTPNGAIPMPPG